MSAVRSFARERSVAVAAVHRACHVAQLVFDQLVKNETMTKSDNSPVTVADYATQALISTLLFHHFPEDALVGEEDSADLRLPAQATLTNKVVSLANTALRYYSPCQGDNLEWGALQDSTRSADAWLSAIDRGKANQTRFGRVWTLDPIDGTKGFLRGGQYAICLALLQQGAPVLGVIGCPNLALDQMKSEASGKGALFIAEAGRGATTRSLTSDVESCISMRQIQSSTSAIFCESVEAGHSDQGTNASIARNLGITKAPVRMDSQAKYCSIARGDADIYLRLPVRQDYEEKIWDHAAGSLIVTEANGMVTDVHGKSLDFSLGRTLASNKGIVAAAKSMHPAVLTAIVSSDQTLMTCYLAIVSHRDTPLYEAHFACSKSAAGSTNGPTSSSVFGIDADGKSAIGYGPRTSKHVQQLVAHASLDSIEDAQWKSSFMYLRNVDCFREWNISAWLSPGGLKIVLLHDFRADDAIRSFLHDCWESYTKAALNPFYEVGGQIQSSAFDSRVRASARKYL